MDSSAATPTNKPIFVVGSPRSGTSILSWCLGQHPNILVIPESAWMGDFTIDLAICFLYGWVKGVTAAMRELHRVLPRRRLSP